MVKFYKDNLASYTIRRLREDEVIESFDCGDKDLNDFIINNAHDYHKAKLSETYVFEHIASGKLIAYFSLANDRISIDDFKNNTEFNRFRKHRFVNEKRIKSYPAVKICRLGIDNGQQTTVNSQRSTVNSQRSIRRDASNTPKKINTMCLTRLSLGHRAMAIKNRHKLFLFY